MLSMCDQIHSSDYIRFGDLVTLDWWSDLWLNEGFASYLEYLGADFVSKHLSCRWIDKHIIHLYLHMLVYRLNPILVW